MGERINDDAAVGNKIGQFHIGIINSLHIVSKALHPIGNPTLQAFLTFLLIADLYSLVDLLYNVGGQTHDDISFFTVPLPVQGSVILILHLGDGEVAGIFQLLKNHLAVCNA